MTVFYFSVKAQTTAAYSDADSPPSMEPIAPQIPNGERPDVTGCTVSLIVPVDQLIESVANRTEPSAKLTLTPLVWKLLAEFIERALY